MENRGGGRVRGRGSFANSSQETEGKERYWEPNLATKKGCGWSISLLRGLGGKKKKKGTINDSTGAQLTGGLLGGLGGSGEKRWGSHEESLSPEDGTTASTVRDGGRGIY